MASVTDSLKRSSINITNISKSLFDTKRSVSTLNDSVDNISKIISTNTRVKNELFQNSQIIDSRRREASKRQEIEDQIESSRVSTAPSRGISFASRSDKGPLGRLIGFLGFTFAGWIVENLPTWIFMGKEFISRIETFGKSMYSMVNSIKLITESFGSVLENSFNAILRLNFNEFSEGSVAKSFDELNLAVQGLGGDITETFKLFTTPLNQSVETGEQAPGLGEDRPETMFPPSSSQGSLQGTNQDLYTLATIVSIESASPQGRADVAQSIYNRMKQRGQTATQVVTAPGQYSPFFAAPEQAKNIKTYEDAVNYLVKYKGYTRKTAENMIQSTISSLQNPQLQAEASRFIGSRTSFRGSPQNYKSLSNVVWRGSRSDNQFLNEEIVSGKPASIPTFISQPSTSSTTNTQQRPPLDLKKLGFSVGDRAGYIPRRGRIHAGRDIAIAHGTPVSVISDATITDRGIEPGYGYYVTYVDSNGIEHFYGHLREMPKVSKGQKLSAGTIIGHVGSTGWSTGPHLHWEVSPRIGEVGRPRKNVIDPIEYGFSASAPFKGSKAQISAPPSRVAQPAAMTPQRKGSSVVIIDDTKPQQSQVAYPSQQPSYTPTISEFKLLNNFIKNKLLLDLAYL